MDAVCRRWYAPGMKHAPGFLRLVDAARTRIRECAVADVKRRLDAGERFHLIDVREQDEWARGHLPHARHLSKGIIERDIETVVPDPDADIVLYCGGGYRSALAADSLRQMGYRRVASMDGGWRGWTEAGYPVTRD
jgi:rhodanese-related sulfurtransferase